MQRRSVIAGFAVSLIAPQESLAQQASAKIPRVGILTLGDNDRTPMLDAFRGGSATSAMSRAAISSSNFASPEAIVPLGRSWGRNWWHSRSTL